MDASHTGQETSQGQHQKDSNDDSNERKEHDAATGLHDIRNEGRHDVIVCFVGRIDKLQWLVTTMKSVC